jgi:hypothetical protein
MAKKASGWHLKCKKCGAEYFTTEDEKHDSGLCRSCEIDKQREKAHAVRKSGKSGSGYGLPSMRF